MTLGKLFNTIETFVNCLPLSKRGVRQANTRASSS
jgi:hypothetical protein